MCVCVSDTTITTYKSRVHCSTLGYLVASLLFTVFYFMFKTLAASLNYICDDVYLFFLSLTNDKDVHNKTLNSHGRFFIKK